MPKGGRSDLFFGGGCLRAVEALALATLKEAHRHPEQYPLRIGVFGAKGFALVHLSAAELFS